MAYKNRAIDRCGWSPDSHLLTNRTLQAFGRRESNSDREHGGQRNRTFLGIKIHLLRAYIGPVNRFRRQPEQRQTSVKQIGSTEASLRNEVRDQPGPGVPSRKPDLMLRMKTGYGLLGWSRVKGFYDNIPAVARIPTVPLT